MKTRLIIIIIAGLLVIAAAAAAVVIIPKIADRPPDYLHDIPLEQTVSEEGLTPFEYAIIAGGFPRDMNGHYHPLDTCESFIGYSAAQNSVELEFTLVHERERSGGAYNLWSARYVTDSVDSFYGQFEVPYHFNCTAGNKSASMTAAKSYSGNYMKVSVVLTYLENGEAVTRRADGAGNVEEISARADYSGAGRLVEASYFFYQALGTRDFTDYGNVAVIHVVDKEYTEAGSRPYTSLLESYTVISSKDITVEVPRG